MHTKGPCDEGSPTVLLLRCQVPNTVDIDAACTSYYTSLFPVNPGGLVPSGPRASDLRLDLPSGRGATTAALDACYSWE